MGEKPAPPSPPARELPPDAPLRDRVVAVLETVYDPELPVNIHDLGLIYELNVSDSGEVAIKMTLTSPNCPVAGSLVEEVRKKVAAVPGVSAAQVELVWEPPWDKSRLSEAAALELGLF
jgi:FeS assembly SUF system protein